MFALSKKFGIVMAACVGLFLANAAKAQAQDRYAAIAFSESTGQYAWVVGRLRLDDAEVDALRNLNAPDGRVVTWSRNGWCVLMKGEGGYAWSNGATENIARQNALDNANRLGLRNPSVLVSVRARN